MTSSPTGLPVLWGGMLNVLVLLFFIANTALAVRAARPNKLVI